MKLIGGCATYIGNTRDVNQDAILYRSSARGEECFAVLAVCDGIGGLEHGEIASSIVVRGIDDWYDGVLKWIDIAAIEPDVLYAHLKDAAENFNLSVCEYRNENGISTGTTMSLLMIIRDRYYVIQVGDSRIYRYHKGCLSQLTVDASVSRLKNGRMKAYLDNFMGKNRELWFTSASGRICKGDLFLACSDGLYHKLLPKDIERIYGDAKNQKKIESVCNSLIETMMARGETDNISAGIVMADEKKRFFTR